MITDSNPIHKCPHCSKCIALAHKRDECISVAFHKFEPPRRPNVVQLIAYRRCAHADCKQDFIVECYAPIHELLHWLIFKDPDYMAQAVFDDNPQLIKKLRQSPRFMKLINSSEFDD